MALVSRRFAALVWACVPDLKLKVEANGLQSLPALRLLAGWLRRSGQHLRQLTLRLHGNDELAEEDASTLAAAATACFEALGQAGGPEPAASRPMMLHSLELSGHPLSLPAGLRLPPSITRLDLYRSRHKAMPRQVRLQPAGCAGQASDHALWQRTGHAPIPSAARWLQFAQLPLLAGLSLIDCPFSPASLAPLSSLRGSLTYLYIEQCHPPPSLAALTRLQHLSLSPGSAEGIAMLDGALPQLQQLTCLVGAQPRQGACHGGALR